MNSMTNTTNEDIINEITGIEYEDDDALTLLDDEEMQTSADETDDEDLNSFYLDYSSPSEQKETIDLYTEKTVEVEDEKSVSPTVEMPAVVDDVQSVITTAPPVQSVVQQPVEDNKKTEEGKDLKKSGYQNKLDQLSTNIDAYLNGSLDNRRDEVKVERMEPVVVKAPQVAESRVQSVTPQEQQPVVNQVSQSQQASNAVPVINSTNIDSNLNQLFAKVSNNVRGASDVKRKMEERYQELRKLYDDFEKKKKADYDEINAYKDEVYNKLKIKKEELDDQAKRLKMEQDTLANQKKQFEAEKQRVKEEHKKKEQELFAAFKEREKNIEQVEAGLIKRKEQLDLEKINIANERAKCEQEKKELADNLVKFNQIVDDFTKGVDRFGESN